MTNKNYKQAFAIMSFINDITTYQMSLHYVIVFFEVVTVHHYKHYVKQ